MSRTLSATSLAPATFPGVIPIFPLPGVVLLPRARLPLHIFEPRYLAMVDDVLASQHRLIGMIQPTADEPSGSNDKPALYKIGCAGRLTSFAETDDGRMMISLTGLCRFEISEEVDDNAPYRQARAAWEPFVTDLNPCTGATVDHARMAQALLPYLKAQNIEADWASIENMEDEMLVSTLTMICPLAPNEKQALLEAPDLTARAAMLMTLLEMSSMPPAEGNAKH